MNFALWVVQALLAIAFLMAGFQHGFQPLDNLANSIRWVSAVPPALVRFIGVSELLGGVGIVLPALSGVLPWLTPLAGVGLMAVMASASVFHVSRHESSAAAMTGALFALAAFVAYGRWVLSPII